MKRIKTTSILVVICIICLLTACASTGKNSGLTLHEAIEKSAQEIAEELPPDSRVAIVAFESANDNLSEYIMEELNAELLKHRIVIVDRQNLQRVQQELDFQMSGYVSDESAQSIGKFLGATAVLTGQMTDLGDVFRFRISVIYIEEGRRGALIRHNVQNNRAMQDLINTLARQR